MGKLNVLVNFDPSCGLRDSNDEQYFTSSQTVRGSVSVKIQKDVAIKGISISLFGELVTQYDTVEMIGDQVNYRTYVEGHTFLKEPKCTLFPTRELASSGASSHTFIKGSDHSYDFALNIPQESVCSTCLNAASHSLPPTFALFQAGDAKAEINYVLKVEVDCEGFFSSNRYYIFPFRYCPPGVDPSTIPPPNRLSLNESKIFEKKVKKFIDSEDPEKPEKIVCPIHDDHKHTRLVRRLFNDNYKKVNYSKYVSDVPLNLTLVGDINPLYIPGSTMDDLQFLFSCPVEDLLEQGYILRCNESSKLGEFFISGLRVSLKINTIILTRGHRTASSFSKVLHYSEPNEIFDIAQFAKDKQRSNHYKQFSIIEILLGDSNEHKTVMDNIQIPSNISPSFSACNALTRSYEIVVELYVARELKQRPQCFKFTYEVKVGF